jgi:hypothetical protein
VDPNRFAGFWRIVWMKNWEQDYVDMDGPGNFTFSTGRSGSFQFGLVQGQMDCKVAQQGQRIDFTWHGFDEGTDHTGRGHARIVNGELRGHVYFHLGDDSAFRAARQLMPKRDRKTTK